MTDNETNSKQDSSSTIARGIEPLWDEKKLESESKEFSSWANALPATDSTDTSIATDKPGSPGTTSTGNSSTSTGNAENIDSNDEHPSIPHTQKIFVPKVNQRGIWHDSPNKERHAASFGEGGTTASASCFGDLMQMSQYLGVGISGVFSLDQSRTSQPFWVIPRAEDLDNLTRAIRDEFSYGLILPDEYLADEANPPEVQWVNWKWPRYEYNARNNEKIKACFQFMAHNGVVLQQFTLENTGDEAVEVGPFRVDTTVRIRDLDFLQPEDEENEESHRLGPNGYGHVCARLLPDGAPGHAVASVCTTFVNGSVVKFNGQDEKDSTFLKSFELGGSTSGRNKVEIVLARRLIALPKGPCDWRNFIISAKAGNINEWLREEGEEWHADEGQQVLPCLARLATTGVKSTNTMVARGGTDPQGAKDEVTAPHGPERDGSNNAGVDVHRDWGSFKMPSGTSNWSENWNPKDHLEYFAWRHLEHILCACAMPLSPPGLVEVGASGEVEMPGQQPSPPVALTCGDMSGHRINTVASFFAFKFLVDVGRRLHLLKRKTKYILSLETRIKNVCSGHVKWLQHIRKIDYDPFANFAQRPPWHDEEMTNEYITQAGCFAANYWVTGKIMPEHLATLTWLPQNRMTDTALQVLKLAEYKKLVLDPKDMGYSVAQELMNDVYVPWLTELDRLDIRKTCSWPHSNIEGILKFRLDDHFWIWKALKSLDDTVTKVRLPPRHHREHSKDILEVHSTWLQRLYKDAPDEQGSSLGGASSASEDESQVDAVTSAQRFANEAKLEASIRSFMEVAKRLSPNNLQRTVLQRFTAENDVMKPARRMLTVTRSAMDMRFLLHARDTALFYGEDSGFFSPGSSFTQLWRNTIDAQLHQEENMYVDSDNALRYALGIAMGVRGHRLSSTSDTSELVKRSVNILIGAGGSDAFFPGQLDEGAREPTIFSEEAYRDHFYHAGFEINYVLLSSASIVDDIFSEGGMNLSVEPRDDGFPSFSRAPSPQRQPSQMEIPKTLWKRGTNLPVVPDMRNMMRVPDAQPEVLMKTFLPFTNAIPATNVTYIGDEWLYQYPDFLRGRLDLEETKVDEILAVAFEVDKTLATAEDPSAIFVDLCHKILEEPASEYESSYSKAKSSQLGTAVHVVDTRKGKQYVGKSHTMYNYTEKRGPKSTRYAMFSIGELCRFLRKPRTAWTAKKRLVWLPYAEPATVLACRVFSSARERNELSRFFERHALYTKDVLDETSMVANEWRTELHLSFYLCDRASTTEFGAGLPRRDYISLCFPRYFDLEIRRASMSFRFDGDIFDRFWTCHFIEHMPVSDVRAAWDHAFTVNQNGIFDKQWSQRKVLELYLLDRILEKMNGASAQFLANIREMLEIEQVSLPLASLTSEASTEDLQRLEKILQLVEEDLAANLDTLGEKWDRREKDRGAEKPRWTPNDEKKYRASINKLRVDVERATGRLKANQDDIRKLKEFVATTRENRKVEMERRREERDRLRDSDIRYFTYVTVIFQPLGFAASFYSMGGAPESSLIVSLVEFSAAAFAVTLALIWGYRKVVSRYEDDGVLQKSSVQAENSWRDLKRREFSLQRVLYLIRGVAEWTVQFFWIIGNWFWTCVYEGKRINIVVFYKEMSRKSLGGDGIVDV